MLIWSWSSHNYYLLRSLQNGKKLLTFLTLRGHACSFVGLNPITPYWLLEETRGIEIIAVDAVELSTVTHQTAQLVRDGETIYCTNASGFHSLQYPFQQSVTSEENIEYQPCLSCHLVNVNSIPSVDIIANVQIGVMAVLLIQNRFLVINLIREMFSHDDSDYVETSISDRKTEFQKAIEKEWRQYQQPASVNMNWVEISEVENLQILKSVLTKWNENGLAFSEKVRIMIDTKLESIEANRAQQIEKVERAERKLRRQEKKYKEQIERLEKLVSDL